MVDLVLQHPLLKDIAKDELQQLIPYLSHKIYEKETKIIEQGHKGNYVYLIISGNVHIKLEQATLVHIATLEAGAFFGEMSCLTGDPISASVFADDMVEVLTLDHEGMLQLMEKSKPFQKHMMDAMIHRIQQANERVAEEYTKNLYFMKRNEWHDRDKYGELIGESDQIKQIRSDIKQLAQHEGVIYIIGEAGTGKTHIAKRMHYLSKRQSEPVLMVSASELNWNDWASMIITAKRGTIIVTEGEELSSSQLHELIEKSKGTALFIESTQPISIQTSQAIGAKELYVAPLRERAQDIPLIAKHYLSKDSGQGEAISEEALRTLTLFPYLSGNIGELITVIEGAYLLSEGRMIQTSHIRFPSTRKPGSRPKIGLALGSGSIRGISHIGVIKVLEQANIPIDYIAGTSAGSLVGGAYAAGMSIHDLEKAVEKMKWNNVVGFTFPKRSIVHNDPLTKYIKSYLGDICIEQLHTPFAAIASDANTGEAHIMREGSLAKAITASTAIPAVIRPVLYQGKTLVDGAVVHPVPAALVRSMGADLVIAVNVCAESFTKGAPSNFVKSLLNTIDIMSAKIVKEELQLADIIIRPELDHIVNGFKDFQSYIKAGELAALQHLSTIQEQYRLLH